MTSMNVNTVAIPLYGALDTKTSHKSLPSTNVSINKNARYNNTGRVSKRLGQQEVGSVTTTPEGVGDVLTNAKAMGVYNNEMLLIDDTSFYTYLEGVTKWNNLGPAVNFNLSAEANTGTDILGELRHDVQSFRGSGPAGNLTEVQIWVDTTVDGTSHDCFYTIRDVETEAPYVVSQILHTVVGQTSISQIASGGYGSYFYVAADNGYLYLFDLRMPQVSPSYAAIVGGAVNKGTSVACSNSFAILQLVSGANIQAYQFPLGSLSSTNFVGTAPTGLIVATSILAPFNGSSNFPVAITMATGSSQTNLAVTVFVPDTGYLDGLFLNSVIVMNNGGGFNLATLHPYPVLGWKDATHFYAWISDFPVFSAAPPQQCYFARSQLLDVTSLPILQIDFVYFGAMLASQGFIGPGGYSYILTVTTDSLSTGDNLSQFLTVFREDAIPLSIHLDGLVFVALTETNWSNLPTPQPTTDGGWSFALTYTSRISYISATQPRVAATLSATALLVVGDYSSCRFLPFNRDCLINCGTVFSYDSSSLVESGFWSYPQDLHAEILISGALGTGTYSYIVVYEWLDASNNRMYSFPSAPVTIVASEGFRTALISFNGEIITRKSGVRAVLYRTLVNQASPYYAVKELASGVDSTQVGYFASIQDGAPDSFAALQRQLYSNPSGTGQVPNDPPPSFVAMSATKTRVFGVSAEDTTKVWYTKPYTQGFAAGWSAYQTITIEAAGGPPTAIGNLDNLLAVFKKSRIYIIAGEGPDATGYPTNGFTEPQQIASVSGCVSPGSVQLTDLGLFYQSQRGIEMLSRSQSIDYTIGLPVNAYRAIPISSVISVPSANQIRFLSVNNDALVYDYIAAQWSTYTNYDGVGGGIWLGNFVRASADGHIYQEVPDIYTDDGVAVPMTIETAWVKPGTIAQGYARVRRFAISGEYSSPHLLQIDIGINYQDYAYSILWNPATSQVVSVTTYGSETPYGDGMYYGGSEPVPTYQLRARMPVQKCESVRYKITDVPNLLTGTGESCSLIELAMEIDVKTGVMRLPANQTE